MQISSVGGPASWNPSQMLSALLSRLDQQSSSTTQNDGATSTPQSQSASAPAINGNNKPSLSSMVLGALMWAQNDSEATAGGPIDASSQPQDPVQSLFSAMDQDGDGTVSQGEMETYIEAKGGTQSEADTLYSLVTQNGAEALSEQQLASQVPPSPGGPQGAQGHRHGHHHHHVSATDTADALVNAIDSNGDGSVDQSEMENFFTSNGGTTSLADSVFGTIDSNGTGAISSSDFASAIESLQKSVASGSASSMMALLNAFTQQTTSAANTVSVAA